MEIFKWVIFRILAGMVLSQRHLYARVLLPSIPNHLYLPVPSIARIDPETLKYLQESSQDPEVKPGLFQGDIALDENIFNKWRVGLSWHIFPDRMWPNATVPFHISELYDPLDYTTIYMAIRTLGFMTCVKFIPWDGNAEDYLLIWPMKYPAGCWSFIGKIGGPQLLSLQPPNEKGPNCLGNEARAMHEIMHALGIFHEQSRPDRDKFVTINFENIIPAFRGNFIKQAKENTTTTFEYDYDSIMHYGTHYFSKSRKQPTITPKYKEAKIGQRKFLSKTDCLKINDLYGCFDDLKNAKKYYAFCRNFGL